MKRILKRILPFFLLCTILCSCLSGCRLLDSFSRSGILWRDEAVGHAVAESLGKRARAVVYFDELPEVTELVIRSDMPVDLTELTALENLTCLDLTEAKVEDYTPLLSCRGLTCLRVGEVDYEANIDVLDLLQEQIKDTDLDTVANYWSHQRAVFSDPVIESEVRTLLSRPEGDLTLADTREIREFSLSDAELMMPEDLELLVHLRELTLKNCGLTSLERLKGLTGLIYLDLEGNSVSDLSDLSSFPNLQVISLKNNGVKDFSPLLSLPELFAVNAAGCPDADPTLLAKIGKLSNLSLADCGITDISFLSGCTGLTVLWLDGNEIADLSPLSGMTGMTVLALTGNRIRDLSPLSGMTGMTNLYLSDNNISDLSPLSGMTELECLQLTLNNVYDVSVIPTFTKLKELGILCNPVTDYAPIAELEREWDSIDVDPAKALKATKAAAQISEEILSQTSDPKKIVQLAHAAVVKSANYDYNSANAGTLGFEVQSTYSVLIRKSAVCAGYAEAMAVICRQCGVDAWVVSGTAGGVEHAWVMVDMNGKAMYSDPTWDDPNSSGILVYEDYLLVSRDSLAATHTWDEERFAL